MADGPRIALIHATPVAMEPIHRAFVEHWPDAEPIDILESALSNDASAGLVSSADFDRRFLALTRYAADIGAEGVLFTCSAFGRSIEAARGQVPQIPVLKPNEAMFEAAFAGGRSTTLLATFAPAVAEMRAEYDAMAAQHEKPPVLDIIVVDGAMEALRSGDQRTHDELCAARASEVNSEVIMLAHFSTARAATAVRAATGKTILTSPDSAVAAIKAAVQL